MLLIRWQEGHTVCKNWVVGCWHGYLSGAGFRFAYGPAYVTASVKSRLVLPPAQNPGQSPKRHKTDVCVCVCVCVCVLLIVLALESCYKQYSISSSRISWWIKNRWIQWMTDIHWFELVPEWICHWRWFYFLSHLFNVHTLPWETSTQNNEFSLKLYTSLMVWVKCETGINSNILLCLIALFYLFIMQFLTLEEQE